jgi:hypothetical protein
MKYRELEYKLEQLEQNVDKVLSTVNKISNHVMDLLQQDKERALTGPERQILKALVDRYAKGPFTRNYLSPTIADFASIVSHHCLYNSKTNILSSK